MKYKETAVIVEQQEIATDIFSMWLQTEAIAKEAVPGQFISVYSSDKSRSHAWFAGYVSGEKPDLVVCVLVESAGSSSEYAVLVAKRVFDAYYAGE